MNVISSTPFIFWQFVILEDNYCIGDTQKTQKINVFSDVKKITEPIQKYAAIILIFALQSNTLKQTLKKKLICFPHYNAIKSKNKRT